MNWKFWKKEDTNTSPMVTIDSDVLPLSTLFRWYCYDTGVETPNKFAEAFGISPISEEGEAMELKESANRLTEVLPYLDFLNVISDVNAAVLTETLTMILEKNGLIDSEQLNGLADTEIMEEIYKNVALGALISAFSSALSLGIIVNPGAVVTEVDDELF